jgi:hypothetical protein
MHIPLKTEDAILAFMKVKPTAQVPRPGANPMKVKTETGEEGEVMVLLDLDALRD